MEEVRQRAALCIEEARDVTRAVLSGPGHQPLADTAVGFHAAPPRLTNLPASFYIQEGACDSQHQACQASPCGLVIAVPSQKLQ